MKSSRIAIVAVILLALAPASAAADQSYFARGALVYSWHGDASRGCAQMGVCGIHGEIVLRPDPSGIDFVADGLRRGEFDLDSLTGTARVHRVDPGSQGDCIEPGA